MLLSRDEHADTLDASGRAMLSHAPTASMTPEGAARRSGNARGLPAWSSAVIRRGALRVTAVPGCHGPEGCEPLLGEVTGFVLEPLQTAR